VVGAGKIDGVAAMLNAVAACNASPDVGDVGDFLANPIFA
jgi:hypothetical protein